MEENSFSIIKDGIENEDNDSKIIEKIQENFPTSSIENNIFIIDETRGLLEKTLKISLNKMESDYFLIPKGNRYIDITTGRTFEKFKNIPYSKCVHGLCKKYNTLVLKNIIENESGFVPNVLIAVNKKEKFYKPIRIKYQNENKKQQIWEFDSQEINRCIECIDEGLSDRQIAVALFCPRECVQKLIKHIDINQKMSGGRNGRNNKSKSQTRVGQRRTGRKTRREN